MGYETQRLYADVVGLKKVLLENHNLDVLLYLAKYNPDVRKEDLIQTFGQTTESGLEDMKRFHLVEEKKGWVSLTHEGIFQVDGLLTMIG
jgi:hypothetical protein